MAEDETAALGEELLWRERAMWLLVRRLGGTVAITDEEWESMPQRPDLIITRAGSVMRWTALEPGPVPAADQERGDEDDGLLPFPEAT